MTNFLISVPILIPINVDLHIWLHVSIFSVLAFYLTSMDALEPVTVYVVLSVNSYKSIYFIQFSRFCNWFFLGFTIQKNTQISQEMLRKNSHMESLAVIDDNIHNQPECLGTQTGNKNKHGSSRHRAYNRVKEGNTTHMSRDITTWSQITMSPTLPLSRQRWEAAKGKDKVDSTQTILKRSQRIFVPLA